MRCSASAHAPCTSVLTVSCSARAACVTRAVASAAIVARRVVIRAAARSAVRAAISVGASRRASAHPEALVRAALAGAEPRDEVAIAQRLERRHRVGIAVVAQYPASRRAVLQPSSST
jgi:hypothetical protein